MNSLRAMWGNTLMVVLTSMSAALYAAILIPFKILPIIPGVTEVRPANAIPIVCALLFGPAGAVGSALGNLIGDFFLGLGPGSVFGMAGNFLYGFVPYVFWRAMFGTQTPQFGPLPFVGGRVAHWIGLVFICFVASAACALSIAWGIDVVIQGVPFAVLGTIIFFNNFIMSVLLSGPLVYALLPRVRKWGLLYTQILPEEASRRPRLAAVGVVVMTVGALGGLGGGLAIATGLYDQPVGVPQMWKALVRPFASGSAAAPAKAPPAGVKAAPGKAEAAADEKPSAPRPADWRARARAGLALGVLPALGLMALAVVLL